jgi:hypothetical protein
MSCSKSLLLQLTAKGGQNRDNNCNWPINSLETFTNLVWRPQLRLLDPFLNETAEFERFYFAQLGSIQKWRLILKFLNSL